MHKKLPFRLFFRNNCNEGIIIPGYPSLDETLEFLKSLDINISDIIINEIALFYNKEYQIKLKEQDAEKLEMILKIMGY